MSSQDTVPADFMGSKSRPRRFLLSTALLSAITVVALVAWLYVFRHGPQNSPSPSSAFTLSDLEKGNVTAKPDTDATATAGSNSNSSLPATALMPASEPAVSSAPVVKLRQGTYIGATIPSSDSYPKAIEAFRGIPFAETTAGESRFRLPVPIGPSDGTFEAVALGQSCPGSNATNATGEVTIEGEDCLNLNVYRPRGARPADRRLPVVVYVHGGGFNGGVGTERNMASFVSWAKEPIIAVNFNYRVGALGFLPSAVTAREGLLNLGLKDQQLLFAWVRDNVAAFGGDADNITLMGLSAGAHSIGHHLMYYSRSSTPAPFAKAILESGATTARSVLYPTHPRHLKQFREFLIAAGIAGVPEQDVFPTLRKLPVGTITRASRAIWDRYNATVCWPFQPVIDGPNSLSNSSHAIGRPGDDGGAIPASVIPDLPVESWREGNHLRIPVLTGFNTNEGTMFVPQHAGSNEDFRKFFTTLIPGLRTQDLEALEALYPDPVTNPSSPYKTVLKGMGRQWARLDAAYSHFAYICPVLQTAHFLSTADDATGRPSSSTVFSKSSHHPSPDGGVTEERSASPGAGRAPVYVYRYAATGTWGTANHGDEAPVVAHDMGVVAPRRGGPRPGIRNIADAMHGAWVNFIVSRDGDPNPVPSPTNSNANATANANSTETTTTVRWAPFESPLAAPGSGPGQSHVMVFGEGNDEREPPEFRSRPGPRRPGTAARPETLSAAEVERCRFWWERIELSEGVGRARAALDRGAKL